MLRGNIDAVTTLGYLEGWAFETDDPIKPLEVAVFSRANEVASGVAHGFRPDLMKAGFGLGWCAFKIRLNCLISDVRNVPLRLLERRTGAQICIVAGLFLIEDPEPTLAEGNIETSIDASLIEGTWQLQGCEDLFLRFISVNGLENFLRAAYDYMMGRPADENEMIKYAEAIRRKSLTPCGALAALEGSDEFRSRGRAPVAPNSKYFPFK